MHDFSNIGFSSDGGPGSRITWFFSAEIHRPGAVPLLFSRISEPGEDQRLPRIVGRHLDASRFEPALQSCQNFVIQNELALQHPGNDFSRDVVFGRAQAADGDENRRALERAAHGVLQIVLIVPDDRLHHDGNANARSVVL